MKFRPLYHFSILTLILFSCSNAPAVEAVKEKLTGDYCKDKHKLELHKDGTYYNLRVHKGALSGTPVFESCEGAWKVEWDGGKGGWMLVLEKSTKNSSPVSKCGGTSQLVWKKEGGYMMKDSTMVLTEMFEGIEVAKGKCD